MPTLFLAPCTRQQAKEHFRTTVLQSASKDKYDSMWGVPEGQKSQWNKIDIGDYLLFYTGDYEYSYAAKVTGKWLNEERGNELWDVYRGQSGRRGGSTRGPWHHLIHLASPVQVDISSKELHEWAGYTKDFTQTFHSLNDEGHREITRRFGGVEEYLKSKETNSLKTDDNDIDR